MSPAFPWHLVAALAALWAIAGAALFGAREGSAYPKVDAIAFHVAGRLAIEGRLGDLYEHRTERLVIEIDRAAGLPSWAPRELRLARVLPGPAFAQEALAVGYRDPNPPVFVYLPAFAVLAAPLTLVGWPGSAAVVDVANLFLFALALGAILWRARDWSACRPVMFPGALVAALAVALASHPVRFHLFCGQVSMMLAAGVVLAALLGEGRRMPFAAGVLLGVGAAIKFLPLIVFPALYVLGRDRALRAAVATIAVLIVVSVLVPGGVGPAIDAIGAMVAGLRVWGENHSMDALVGRFAVPVNLTQDWIAIEPQPLRPLAVGLKLLLLLWVAAQLADLRARPTSDLPAAHLASLALLLMALLPPLSWTHYLVFAAPALLLLVASERVGVQLAGALLTALVLPGPGFWRVGHDLLVPIAGEDVASVAYRVMLGLPCLAMVGMVPVLCREARRAPSC